MGMPKKKWRRELKGQLDNTWKMAIKWCELVVRQTDK